MSGKPPKNQGAPPTLALPCEKLLLEMPPSAHYLNTAYSHSLSTYPCLSPPKYREPGDFPAVAPPLLFHSFLDCPPLLSFFVSSPTT